VGKVIEAIDINPKLKFLDYRVELPKEELCSYTFNEIKQFKILVVIKNWHEELSDLTKSGISTRELDDEISSHFFKREREFKKDMTEALDKAAKEVLAKHSEEEASYCQKYIVIREKEEAA
jgi:hypothetical protein